MTLDLELSLGMFALGPLALIYTFFQPASSMWQAIRLALGYNCEQIEAWHSVRSQSGRKTRSTTNRQGCQVQTGNFLTLGLHNFTRSRNSVPAWHRVDLGVYALSVVEGRREEAHRHKSESS